jgi:hypothetical protein
MMQRQTELKAILPKAKMERKINLSIMSNLPRTHADWAKDFGVGRIDGSLASFQTFQFRWDRIVISALDGSMGICRRCADTDPICEQDDSYHGVKIEETEEKTLCYVPVETLLRSARQINAVSRVLVLRVLNKRIKKMSISLYTKSVRARVSKSFDHSFS